GKQCEEEGTSFGTPGKVHRVPKRITDVDDFYIILRTMGLGGLKIDIIVQFYKVMTFEHCVYHRAIMKYREEGRPLIYEYETYIHSTHTRPNNLSDGTSSCLLPPISK
ncbi:hypothetical protein C0J52_19778, partial [Blattella germanica]